MAFTEPLQRDALGELVNIGMGQAGESLARLFDSLHPALDPADRADRAGAGHRRDSPRWSAPTARGRGAPGILQPDPRPRHSRSTRRRAATGSPTIVGYPDVTSDELLLEVSNILIGACVSGVAQPVRARPHVLAAVILGRSSVTELFDGRTLPWDRALIAEVNFRVVERPFLLPPADVSGPMRPLAVLMRAVDAFLAEL